MLQILMLRSIFYWLRRRRPETNGQFQLPTTPTNSMAVPKDGMDASPHIMTASQILN